MAGLEQVAPVTSDKKTETKEPIKKIESWVSSDAVDYNLDKVNEQKFQEFKKMTDYIKEKGWKYEEEYHNIVNKIITPFGEQIQKILNKNITKNVDSMSDIEIAKEADKIMKNQPKEVNGQQELIKKINWNWSPKEISKLNEFVTENMTDVRSFYKKITEDKNTKEKAD